MRQFYASRLSTDSLRLLTAPSAELVSKSGGLLRSVPPGSEHLTHVFLGECERTVEELREALAPIEQMPRLRLSLGSTRVFSVRSRPRLVCLDVLENADQIEALGEAVRSCLLPLLPELADYRIKRPHVTLARFSRRARRADASQVEKLIANGALAGWATRETLATVELIRSDLDHRGASYVTLDTMSLQPAAS